MEGIPGTDNAGFRDELVAKMDACMTSRTLAEAAGDDHFEDCNNFLQ